MASLILTSNLTVNGNLNIGNGLSTSVRGISALTGSLNHTVNGNVTVNSTASPAFVGVRASSTATPVDVSCTWNIHGNVTVTAGKFSMLESPFGAEPGGTAVFNIDGDLIIAVNGIVQIGSSSTGTIGTGSINLKGNVINLSSTSSTGIIPTGKNTTTTSAPTLNINLVGTSQQTWTGPGPVTSWTTGNRVCVVNVNNPNNVRLNNPLTINGNNAFTAGVNGNVYLKLTNGKLLTDAVNVLTVTGSTVIGGSLTSFVNGPMINTLALGATPTVLTFPVGKGSIYRPLSLNITQDSAKNTTYMTELFNAPPAARNLPGTLTKVSSVRYWNITKGSGATVTAATITLNYDNGDGVTDIAHLRIAKDDGAGNWVDLGGTGNAPATGSILSTNAFTSFGDFTLANSTGGTNDLPVELTSFTASAVNNSVSLQWSTATENQNSGWNVERAKDNNWEMIGFVKGNGNSVSILNYSFIDKTAFSGKYNYRLKQIDYNGTYKYSKSVEVNVALPKAYSVQNYPNPFNPSTVIRFAVPVAGIVNLTVYNLLGEKVVTIINERMEQGVYERSFSGNNLATGVYICKLTAGNFTLSKKMILMK